MFSIGKVTMRLTLAALASAMLFACGGGGSGSGGILYYPYETVYGDICSTFEPTPGCTFDRSTGLRITVVEDSDYNRFGSGSDDMWFVQFNSQGRADVYNSAGFYQYSADVSDFAGWVGGNYIGVGTTGLFWEDIRNGQYWLGRNGVLYSANSFDGNYGEAINDDTAGDATDTNFSAINSDGNKKLVKLAANKLSSEYGFTTEKATAVASALNAYAVAGAERGYTTTKDMDKTFRTVFGVGYMDALAAVKEYHESQSTSGLKNVTNRSAAALGVKPHQAKKFMKNMYKKALAEWGYGDADSLDW